jgi:hypothetical protein
MLVEESVINEKVKKFDEPKNLVSILLPKAVAALWQKRQNLVWLKLLRGNIFSWPGKI